MTARARTTSRERPGRTTATRARAARGREPVPGAVPAAEDGRRLDLLRQMLLVRRFEERCVELYSGSEIRGFVHLCIGEEAVAVGVTGALDADDTIVSTYREHGHALARGIPLDAVMAEMFGKVTGCSGGRGGSMHLFDTSRRFYGGNAIVGGGLPLAIGLALADKMRAEDRVTACFFGDGAVAEGEFHETLNLAALWDLPVLFCCENNRYAMGTPLEREQAQTDLALRAGSYGIPAWPVDGMDVLATERAAARGAEAVRAGGGPHFLELLTYRFRAHSMYDPELYRDKAEVELWKLRDPIELLAAAMRADGKLTDAELAGMEERIASDLDRSVAAAREAPDEPEETLTRYVYTPGCS